MKILRRMSAAAIAAVTATSCLAAVANAESEEYRLLVSPISISSASKDLAITDSGFISVTDEDIDNWQKTGKFTYSELSTDFDIPESASIVKRITGNYVAVRADDTGETKSSLKVLSYNPDAKTLTTKTDFGTKWNSVTSDCTVISLISDNEAKKLSITVTPVDGESVTNTLEYKGAGDWFYNCISLYDNPKYVYAILWMSNIKTIKFKETETLNTYSYEIYGITRDGKLETLYSVPEYEGDTYNGDVVVNMGWFSVGDNFISWNEEYAPKPMQRLIYSLDSGKISSGDIYIYDLDLKCKYTNGEGTSRIDAVTQIWNNTFIAECPIDYTSDPEQYRYILFQNNDSYFTTLSNAYKSMSSNDGKIFLVQNADGKWGYIDANGKELAFFDGADNFNGDYAPVIKDGKAYLIDRSMNRVSEMVDADSINSIGNDRMFAIKKDGKTYLAAFALPAPDKPDTTDTSSDTSSDTDDTSGTPTSTPVSSGSSETSGSDDGNPPTSAAFGLMFSLTAIAGAVAVVSRKKR